MGAPEKQKKPLTEGNESSGMKQAADNLKRTIPTANPNKPGKGKPK